MLEPVNYLPVGLSIGAYKVPKNVTIIGDVSVRETETGASGVLVRNNQTGIYSLFSCGALRSVVQKDAKTLETHLQQLPNQG